jgi:hypothetical protein
LRASGERHPTASLFFVSFWAHFQNCFLPCLLPVGAVDSDHPGACPAGSLLAAVLVRQGAEPYYALQRSVPAAASCCSCGQTLAGRPWCRAGEAGPSPIKQARPACSSWPLLLSARVEHEPVGTQERPANEPAVARCLLHYVMVHFARSYKGRNTSFPALKLPSDPAREIAYS